MAAQAVAHHQPLRGEATPEATAAADARAAVQLIDAGKAEREAWRWEEVIRAMVPPHALPGLDVALHELRRQDALRGLSYEEDAWRAAGCWLIEHGMADAWAQLHRELSHWHVCLAPDEYAPEDGSYDPGVAWAFLYGPKWRERRPELARLHDWRDGAAPLPPDEAERLGTVITGITTAADARRASDHLRAVLPSHLLRLTNNLEDFLTTEGTDNGRALFRRVGLALVSAGRSLLWPQLYAAEAGAQGWLGLPEVPKDDPDALKAAAAFLAAD